jgi:protein tyrosine/serine phosphatase
MFLSLNSYAQPRVRPIQWAQPVIGTHLKNFYQLDEGVYRSRQPDDEDFAMLQGMGIKEVLNLRHHFSDKGEAKNTAITLHHLKLDAGSLTEDDIIKALKIIKNRKGAIVFHCWHGADRTGAVAAAYRIVFNGWSKAQAIDELTQGGYGFHSSLYDNIVQLIENLDTEHVKFHLGLN